MEGLVRTPNRRECQVATKAPLNQLTTASEEHSTPVSPNGKSRTSRPAHRRGFVQATSPITAVEGLSQQEIIDLTKDAEYCADCSRVLGQGNGNAARVFVVVEACSYVCNHLVASNCLIH